MRVRVGACVRACVCVSMRERLDVHVVANVRHRSVNIKTLKPVDADVNAHAETAANVSTDHPPPHTHTFGVSLRATLLRSSLVWASRAPW